MKKVLVIGDSCIDVFRYGKVERLAPEAPVPVIVPEAEHSNPGMAGNVVRNIKALGCEVDFVTNSTVIKKTRYVCSKYNYLLLRVDTNDKCEHISSTFKIGELPYDKYDAIVVSDYNKGFLNKVDIDFITSRHANVFLDTKKVLGLWAAKAKYIKINYQEYLNSKDVLENDSMLKSKTIITRGKHGCDFQNRNYPTKEVPVKDVSGAGDTFLAGLVTEYIKSGNIEQAIKFAQECTTVVIQKTGVSTV